MIKEEEENDFFKIETENKKRQDIFVCITFDVFSSDDTYTHTRLDHMVGSCYSR
jgi:hypothetical protein